MSDLNLLLLFLLLFCAMWAVMAAELLHGAIWLALTSVVLSILMFQLNSPLAAVFELSVCAGLITVVFVSTISLTRRLNREEELKYAAQRMKRFVWLPLVVLAGAALLYFSLEPHAIPTAPLVGGNSEVRTVLWGLRRYDLLGQMLVILAGVFAVVVLFKPGEGRK